MITLKFKVLAALCALMIGIHIINTVLLGALNNYGIYPHRWHDWWTIYTAPFLHGSIPHLINNLIGLVIFSSLLFIHPLGRYLWSSFFIITLGGLLVMAFGRDAVHIGASGWVFGLWSLCIATAWFERKLLNIVVAVLVVFLYGGMLFGVLPTDPRVSFESHLFGVIAGLLCAFMNAAIAKRQ